MTLNLEINRNNMAELIPKFRRALDRTVNLTAQETWGNVMEFSPQDHGRLAGSWKLEDQGNRQYLIATSVVYAAVQNDGRGPYIIKAKRAKALRFVIDGQVIFRKSVRHPGIQGKKYVEKSIDAAESRIDDFIHLALAGEGLI